MMLVTFVSNADGVTSDGLMVGDVNVAKDV